MTAPPAGTDPGAGIRIRPADLGWLAATLGAAIALGFVALRRAADVEGPGPTAAETIGWLAVWAGPALVGAIGAAARRREVLVGAGCSYVWMAALGFSGVTLVLLAPALLFLYAGLRRVDVRAPMSDRRQERPVIAVAIVALLVAAVLGLVMTTTTVCWERTADGSYRVTADAAESSVEGEVQVVIGGDVVAAGCSGGTASVAGVTIALAGLVAAAGLALRVGRAPA